MKPMTLAEAKETIFSQDMPRFIKQSAWWLFQHELGRIIDPSRNKRYTVRKSLTNVLKWMNDQKRRHERSSKALTARQRILMQMLVDGLTQKQMALIMGTQRNSIKTNLAVVRRRLGVESLYQAVAIVVERGWVTVPPAKE